MRKTSILRWLLMALLLTTLTFPALAASCVQCGQDAGDDDYLCTACLLKLLKSEGEPSNLAFKRVYRDYWGNVCLQWTDSEDNAPYRVMYELLEEAPHAFGWTDATDIHAKRHVITRLAPGESYVITLADSQGNTIEYLYEAEEPEINDRLGASFRMATQRHAPSGNIQVLPFTLAELASGNKHTLAVQPHYSNLGYGYLYNFHLTVEAPNGFKDVVYSGTLNLGPGHTYLEEWSRIPMDGYFGYLNRYYGGIPTGDYTVTLYFNGESVFSEAFTIAE